MSIDLPIIAIIDDNIVDAELIGTFLKSAGYTYWIAYSAEHFFREALNRQFNILIIDISLPGEDGLSCLGHLRSNSKAATIVITGSGQENIFIKSIDAGADAFFSKPVRRSDLLAAIYALRKKEEDSFNSYENNEDLTLDKKLRTLSDSIGRKVRLTTTEVELLILLHKGSGEVVSKTEIANSLRISHLKDPDHRVEMILSRLRKKLLLCSIPFPVRSIFGKGKLCESNLKVIDQ